VLTQIRFCLVENRRRRVPALAPEERRAALVQATIPLLHEYGLDVSTRQIAEAAGVAEGTIFGVFENKNSLVTVSVMTALDPQPTVDALAAIDRSQPLRERLATAAALISARFTEHAQLMSSLRKLLITGDGPAVGLRDRMVSDRRRIQTALTEVLEPDAATLRRSPTSVAGLLLLYCGAHTFGPFGDPDGFDPQETVSLLLDGLLIRDDSRGDRSTC
jgi:AcrR family transcriptional regulator